MSFYGGFAVRAEIEGVAKIRVVDRLAPDGCSAREPFHDLVAPFFGGIEPQLVLSQEVQEVTVQLIKFISSVSVRRKRMMRSMVTSAMLTLIVSVPAPAQSLEEMTERLDTAARVFSELFNAPDADIPEGLLEDAECVVVIPGVRRAGFGFGGQYGRGAGTCRRSGGGWVAPSMMALEGGGFGLQIGGSSTDLVLLFMPDDSIKHLLKNEVTLGGDASVAAGPKGRAAGADTNVTFEAEILSYGRSRGLFVGISIEGASLRPDRNANEALYGREISAGEILQGGVPVPVGAQRFIDSLRSN